MKKALLFTTFAVAGLWATPRAEANPVMMCMPDAVTSPSAQSVGLHFEIDASFVTGDLEVYRDTGLGEVDPDSSTAVLVATISAQDGTASQGDTGSGVVNTIEFNLQEDCVPVGNWAWDVFNVDGGGMWCPMNVQITDTEVTCGGTGGGSTGGAAPGGSGGSGAAGAGDTGGAGATGGSVPVVTADDPDDGGCAVRAATSPVGQAGWLGLALGLGLWWRRRR